jgi:hypothetical protein
MRKLAAVLLLSVAVVACKKNEAPAVDTSATVADTATTATTVTETTATEPTVTATTATTASTATETAEPFDFSLPSTDTAPKPVKYEYLVDTLYNWSLDTQRIVAAKTTYGAHFFALSNRAKLDAWRKKQGYEKVKSFDVPGAPSKFPNPFINANRVVIVYRKPR